MLYSKAREIYETKIKEAVFQFATTMRWTNDWEYSKNHKKPMVTRKAHMLVLSRLKPEKPSRIIKRLPLNGLWITLLLRLRKQ